jgi:hypothetical protein
LLVIFVLSDGAFDVNWLAFDERELAFVNAGRNGSGEGSEHDGIV